MRDLLYIALLALTMAPGASIERKAPDAMGLTKRILCDGKWRGQGIPTGGAVILTAAHVTEGCVVLSWDDYSGNHGTIKAVLRRKYEMKDNFPASDFALLLSDTSFPFWADISKRIPPSGEILYSGVLLYGNIQLSTVSGPFIGKNSRGFYESDIKAWAGSSGAPLMDQSGHVLGIVSGGVPGQTQWSTPVSQIFD